MQTLSMGLANCKKKKKEKKEKKRRNNKLTNEELVEGAKGGQAGRQARVGLAVVDVFLLPGLAAGYWLLNKKEK